MLASGPRLYFDFVDPLSWLVERAVSEIEAGAGVRVERVGCQLRPPPAPLTRRFDPFWVARLQEASRAAPHVRLSPPALMPWSGKAHELHVFAQEHGASVAVRRGVFEAFFERGRDIGRIDELVGIAVAAGLDRTRTKAALDVDKHLEDVLAARRAAEQAGISELPSLQVAGKLVQGFRNLTDLSTLLVGSPPGGR